MLTRLFVRNVVLIRELTLDFAGGLTVLTGETGAGKSILLDALGLALGSRADFDLIGIHANTAEVVAIFTVPSTHPAYAILGNAGIEASGTIILKRQLKGGKSFAFINDSPVSVNLLRIIGDNLVEIQGQFEGRGLLDTATHRQLLDRFANAQGETEATGTAWQGWQEADRHYTQARNEAQTARQEEDWLKESLTQLDALAPSDGEEDSLMASRQILANTAKIAEALYQAQGAITGDDGAAARLALAAKSIDRIAELSGDILTPLAQALERTDSEMQEVLASINHAEDALAADPNGLEAIEDRLHALRTQARKHQVAVNDLPQLHRDLADRLGLLEDQSGQLAELHRLAEEAQAEYRRCAEALSQKRREAAARLDALVMRELPDLKLEEARIITHIAPLPEDRHGPHGIDAVRFEVSTNPALPMGAIDRIASGGELARFLLALKVVLASSSAPMVLIFDEVDSGVGGAVATAVGTRLARLGEAMQCLVITHSPQVASRGGHHLQIAKSTADDTVISTAEILGADARLEEISRMLAGATITPEARAAAARLLYHE